MTDPSEGTQKPVRQPADVPTADALTETAETPPAEAPAPAEVAPPAPAAAPSPVQAPATNPYDAPPSTEGLDAFRRKKYNVEFDERTLIWGIIVVLSVLTLFQVFTILGLRGRVASLEKGTTSMTGQPADAVQTTGGAMSWGQDTTSTGAAGWGSTDGGSTGTATDSGWGAAAGTDTSASGWGAAGGTGETGAAGTAGTTDGGTPGASWGAPGVTEGAGATDGAGATPEDGAGGDASSGWGATPGAGGQPQGTVGAMGSGTLPDGALASLKGSAVMKQLEVFITDNSIDAVAADSLRNLVGESQAIQIDINRQVAAGQKSPTDGEVLKGKEKARVKAALETLLGLEGAKALEGQVLQGG